VSKIVSPVLILVLFLTGFTKPVFAGIKSCFDDFSSLSTCDFETFDSSWGFWQRKNDVLFGQTRFFYSENPIFKLAGDNSWSNYSIEADVKGLEGIDKILVGRFQDISHYYILNLRSGFNNLGNDLSLIKICCQGHKKELEWIPFPNSTNTWYHLRLDFFETNIKAYVDNRLIFNYDDNHYPELPFRTGRAGLGIWGGNFSPGNASITKVIFDNVSIKPLNPKDIYILIPGFGSGWNPNAILSCDLAQTADWGMAPYVNIYKRLIDTLSPREKLNEDFFVYSYDWRQEMNTQAELLNTYLTNIMANKDFGTKINIVAHSMGGLIIRSYLNKYPNAYEFGKIITLGTPHTGTPVVYPIWEGAEIPLNDWYFKLAIDIMINNCSRKLNTSNKVSIIQQIVPSLKDLLPIFPYLKDTNGNFVPANEIYAKNDWLLHLAGIPSSLTTIAGNNNETLSSLTITKPSAEEKNARLWIDGKPVENQKVPNGDNTVLVESALLPTSKTIILPNTNHLELNYSDLGIKTILAELDFNDFTIASQNNDSSLSIVSKPTSLEKFQPFIWKRYKLKTR
jgi:pimeloyl-ACP methyl ester carboxylesterase